MYAGDFKAVSKMIEAVKEGKDLPPLNETGNDERGKRAFWSKVLKEVGMA